MGELMTQQPDMFTSFTEEPVGVPPVITDDVVESEATVDIPEVPEVPVQEETPETPPVVAATPTDNIERDRAQLAEAQRAHQQQVDREKVIKDLEQEALIMEQRLLSDGLTEDDAKNQTMRHLQGRVNEIQYKQQAQIQQQVAQGKRNASVHFAKKYQLGIDNLSHLETAQTPEEMENIAKTMSTMSKQKKEIAELKARLSPQQNFDTNTPTPAAATNDERMLDAYLAGDRSDAATAAAAKLLGIS